MPPCAAGLAALGVPERLQILHGGAVIRGVVTSMSAFRSAGPRILAHEIAHVLGMRHPDESSIRASTWAVRRLVFRVVSLRDVRPGSRGVRGQTPGRCSPSRTSTIKRRATPRARATTAESGACERPRPTPMTGCKSPGAAKPRRPPSLTHGAATTSLPAPPKHRAHPLSLDDDLPNRNPRRARGRASRPAPRCRHRGPRPRAAPHTVRLLLLGRSNLATRGAGGRCASPGAHGARPGGITVAPAAAGGGRLRSWCCLATHRG